MDYHLNHNSIMKRILKWTLVVTIISCTLSCTPEQDLADCHIMAREAEIHIVEDFFPNCDDIFRNRMIVSVFVIADQEVTGHEWDIAGQVSTDSEIELMGFGTKEGTVKLHFGDCVWPVRFSVDLSSKSEGACISGNCWRDSRYFEGGVDNIYDETDYGSGPLVVELLDGETLELIATDTTESFDNESTYTFDGLNEGWYVLKFNEIEMDNEFIWLDKTDSPVISDRDSDVNEQGYTEPFFVKDCEPLDHISAGFKVCFADDQDCINEEECSFFVTREDVRFTSTFTSCFNGSAGASVVISTPQDAYFNLYYKSEFLTQGVVGGSNNFVAVKDNSEKVKLTITSGNCNFSDTFDIEYNLPSSNIRGRVWEDSGEIAGKLDPGDEYISFIKVELLDAETLEVLRSTNANSLGVYSFSGVSPDDYIVSFINEDMQLEFVERSSQLGGSIVNENGMTDVITIENCQDKNNVSAALQLK